MASPCRRSARHLDDELLNEGPRFRFFQAVRLLALSRTGGSNKAPLPPDLRFTSPMSLAFQASDIAVIKPRTPGLFAKREPDENADDATNPSPPSPIPANGAGDPVAPGVAGGTPLEMTVGFMGLTGPAGVLPVPYTELLIDRRNQYHDSTGHAFLDLFTHRAVTLFYQAWRKHRFYLPYEAGDRGGFSRNMLDIVGTGLRHLQHRLKTLDGGIPDRFLILYAGLLSQKPIPASNIAALAKGFFGVDAHLEQFVGQWIALPRHEQSALDDRPCILGQTASIGERLWDRQTKVRLRLGPMDRSEFTRFMPGQPGLEALRELLRFCVGLTLDCDVTLILKRSDIPNPVLGGNPEEAPRLGYSAWMNSRPPLRDADDVCFTLLGNKPLAH